MGIFTQFNGQVVPLLAPFSDLLVMDRHVNEINRNFDPGAQARPIPQTRPIPQARPIRQTRLVHRTRRGLQLNQSPAAQPPVRGLTRAGLAATASILELTDTGAQINGTPMVRLSLLVHCAELPPYPIQTEVLLPVRASAQAAVGQRVALMVDPEDHDSVLVRWGQPVN